MRLVTRTSDQLVLENKAPWYRGSLGMLLVSFPLLLLAYVIFAQRSYLDCSRQYTNRVNCQYFQEKDFPVATQERYPLTDVKLTRVYQEIFVNVDGEQTVQNNVLVLGKNNYLYIENFRDLDSASDFKGRLEQFFQFDDQSFATISQNNLDTFWKLLRDPDNSPYYLWAFLSLLAGATLLYDTAHREIYTIDTRTGILKRKQQKFLFKKETDYRLEKIVAVRTEMQKDRFGCSLPRAILTLANGEEIYLNARPLESPGSGLDERAMIEAIEQRLSPQIDEIPV
jgi:hypothetical protein